MDGEAVLGKIWVFWVNIRASPPATSWSNYLRFLSILILTINRTESPMFELESEGIIEVSTIIMLLLELFALRFWREICGGKAGELAPQGNRIMCHSSSYCMMTCWGVRLPGLETGPGRNAVIASHLQWKLCCLLFAAAAVNSWVKHS